MAAAENACHSSVDRNSIDWRLFLQSARLRSVFCVHAGFNGVTKAVAVSVCNGTRHALEIGDGVI